MDESPLVKERTATEQMLHEKSIAEGPFAGMTEDESIEFQLREWVKGNSLHNPIREECCPDFSCCAPIRTPDNVRERFGNATREEQRGMLGMFLGGCISQAQESGELPEKGIYIADGTEPEEH